MDHKLFFMGFGNVGQALAQLLLQKGPGLEQAYGLRWRAIALVTGSHGMAFDPNGIDLAQALQLMAQEGDLSALSTAPGPADPLELIRRSGADVLFENTPVDYHSGQPAIDHLETALESGMHAITANKGPVVHAYQHLKALAGQVQRKFLFESAVMDGAPIFSLWREALPGAELHALRGVLNSTTNLILSLMEEGKSFQQAVQYAQSIGIAETDPSGDIDGWDAAIKVAALVTVLMDVPLLPDQVQREGIRSLDQAAVAEAKQQGKRWKLVCTAEKQAEQVIATVKPQLLEARDPLYQVMGTSSAVTFQSDILGPLTVTEADPGPDTTAYGLLADYLNAIRNQA